jgi:hypothetical protein
LMDRTNNRLMKTAYIGHPNFAGEFTNDGSLVFATPDHKDPNYNRAYTTAPQNFYFYPGAYTGYAEPFVKPDNPPTLNVNHQNRVGIRTFEPDHELEVHGDIGFSGDLYKQGVKLGIWNDQMFANIHTYLTGYPNPTFRGIAYNNPSAPNVGVNSPPDPRYGMTVTGKLRAVNGYYTGDDKLIVPWMDALSSSNVVATSNITGDGAFIMKPVGIGLSTPGAMLDVKQTYGDYTTLRLTRPERPVDPDSTFVPKSRIEFAGVRQPWVMQGDDMGYRLEIAHMASNALLFNDAKRAMYFHYNPVANRHQTVIGGNLTTTITNSSNTTDALIVDGGMTVIGDVTVTGKYRINATTLQNSNIEGYSDIPLNTDDVFIGGKRIILNPKNNDDDYGFVGIGYDVGLLTSLAEENIKVPFRVYQSRANVPEIARFIAQDNALIEIYNRNSGRSLKFGVYNNSFTFMDGNYNPFLSFASNVSRNERYMSFNGSQEKSPTAALHVQTTWDGENMLRLTRYSGSSDNSPFAPEVELEKRTAALLGGEDVKRWRIKGPDASHDQKLSFIYGVSEDRSNDAEMICFTNNRCIGIGNTQPIFALDVAASLSNQGTLRLWAQATNPTPQLILQSGDSLYGGDIKTDYRIYAHSNNFYIDSQNQSDGLQNLMHFNEYGSLGIGTAPTSNYQVNIGGVLNVKSAILLDGNPLFDTSGSEAQNGFYLRAVNIFIQPQIDYSGGLVVNGSRSTSNLFHVFSGNSPNMLVLDSYHNQAQVHFRSTTAPNSLAFNMYRMGQSNQQFKWMHLPNSSNAYAVSSDDIGYSNVISWGPTTRAGMSPDYDLDVYGSAHLISTNPQIRLGPTTSVNTLISNTSTTNHLVLQAHSGNIGLGTDAPLAGAHVTTSTAHALRVDQYSTGHIAQFISNGIEHVRFANDGNVGIGTLAPQTKLHIHDGVVRVSGNASLYTPSFFFTDSPTTGITRPLDDTMVLQTQGVERLRVESNGNVGIGTNSTRSTLHVYASSASAPVTTMTQMSSGDILKLESTSFPHTFVATSTGQIGINTAAPTPGYSLDVVGDTQFTGGLYPSSCNVYDLGSSNLRWKDLYLSGNTMDLGGTKFTRVTDGYVQITDGSLVNNPLTGVVANSVYLQDTMGSNTVRLRVGPSVDVPFVYEVYNASSNTTTEYVPFAQSASTGGISVGVSQSEALLHLATSLNGQPAAIFEQQSSQVNTVIQIRGSNQVPLFHVQNDGNVGIGTTIAQFPLHMQRNASDTTVMKVHQTGTGDIVRFVSDTPSTNTAHVTITHTGSVGIGTTTPTVPLHNYGMSRFDDVATFNEYVYMAQNLEVQGNSITHGDATTDSDIRLKTDLLRIDGALEKVCQLTGYTFTKLQSIAEPIYGRRSTGLIAQEVQKILPEAVVERDDSDKTLGVAYGNMMGLIVEAIKELREEVQQLKTKLR